MLQHRRYRAVAVTPDVIARYLAPTVAVVAAGGGFVEIQYDDGKMDPKTLDQIVGQYGFEFDGAAGSYMLISASGRKVAILAIDYDPTIDPTDAPMGSILIDDTGAWWRKLDDGLSTGKVALVSG